MSTSIQTNLLPHDDLPYFSSEKAKILSEVREFYAHAVNHYKANNLELAEHALVKVLKPFLSKPSMRSVYVKVEDFKEELLDSMYKLGNIYLNSAQYSDNHSKAAAIFQYCAAFAREYHTQQYKIDDVEIDLLHEAYSVEQKFLSFFGIQSVPETTSNKVSEYSTYKKSLDHIRSMAAEKLELIAEWPIDLISERVEVVEETYKKSSFFVNSAPDREINPGLIQQLLKSCLVQLGPPPAGCEHAVIGLGSLAGGKMTPWSDLEFAILISEDRHEYKEYFRNLTKLLHIKVINLGETPLRSIGIESLNNFRTADEGDDWFWDEVIDYALRQACYTVVVQAELFVKNYPNQDKRLIDMVNNIIMDFLDKFEGQLYGAANNVNNGILFYGDKN